MNRSDRAMIHALARENPVGTTSEPVEHPVARTLMAAISAEPRQQARVRARAGLRTRVVLVAAAIALAAGIAVATTPLSVPWIGGPGGFPVASEDTRAALEQDELLHDAPWLSQPHGSPPLDGVEALPSLAFPAGTTYQEAITALYVAVKRSGSVPAGATLGPPLPKDIVVARNADRTILSLTAPFGYDIGTGNVLMPGLAYPATMDMDEIQAAKRAATREGRVVPEGARVSANYLDPCQVIVDGRRGPACS